MKKVFLGLFVAIIALSASAFTYTFEPEGTVYGQTSTDAYTKRVNPYNSTNCNDIDQEICAYIVTEAGEDANVNYGSELDATEISAGTTAGYLISINTGEYSGL